MTRAAQQPTFDVAGAPLSVLVDFDGTISLDDVGDALLARLVADHAAMAELDRRYDEGQIGSRELIGWDMEVLPRDAAILRAEVESMRIDDTFAGLVKFVRSIGGALEVVSDGLGFHIEPMLARVGLDDLPVATNQTVLGAGAAGVSFPFGHPECHVCGTCKRERVRRHQEAGRAVIFVGDGTSDRYAAHHADIVFAKASLAAWCKDVEIDYVPWASLDDVTAWLTAALDSGSLPLEPSGYAEWAQAHGRERGFMCGPEVHSMDRRREA